MLALFALWRERGLANTELCNLTLKFCDSPEQMHREVIDGMIGSDGIRDDPDDSVKHDRPNPFTYELLISKMLENPDGGDDDALNLVRWLQENGIQYSRKVEAWAQKEKYRRERLLRQTTA